MIGFGPHISGFGSDRSTNCAITTAQALIQLPLGPVTPGGPCGPATPDWPAGPGIPSKPSLPGGPIGPGSPWGPDLKIRRMCNA